MAWRTGAALFAEIWPSIAIHVKPDDFRQQFVERLLALFLDCDTDPTDLAGIDPEVDRVLEKLAEFDKYDEEDDVIEEVEEDPRDS
jgi:hypothetical protein